MIPSDDAESTDNGNVYRFAAADTLRTLTHAGELAGIDVSGAELVRIGEHAVYRLPGAIARIARTVAYEPDARKEIAVARWLEAERFPAVRALPVVQPVITDDRVVTFWELLSDHESYGSTAEVASLLVRLHRMTPPSTIGLPQLRPFARVERRIDSNGWLSSDDRAFLRGYLEDLRGRYAKLEFALRPGVIHGDASIGNVIHDAEGNPVFIDLDGFAIGPREWDLVLTAVYYDSFGWHTQEEYVTFSKIYGFNVMDWPGYSVLRDMREFLMVTWLSQKAPESERVSGEVRKRIEALRTGGDKKNWLPY